MPTLSVLLVSLMLSAQVHANPLKGVRGALYESLSRATESATALTTKLKDEACARVLDPMVQVGGELASITERMQASLQRVSQLAGDFDGLPGAAVGTGRAFAAAAMSESLKGPAAIMAFDSSISAYRSEILLPLLGHLAALRDARQDPKLLAESMGYFVGFSISAVLMTQMGQVQTLGALLSVGSELISSPEGDDSAEDDFSAELISTIIESVRDTLLDSSLTLSERLDLLVHIENITLECLKVGAKRGAVLLARHQLRSLLIRHLSAE